MEQCRTEDALLTLGSPFHQDNFCLHSFMANCHFDAFCKYKIFIKYFSVYLKVAVLKAYLIIQC